MKLSHAMVGVAAAALGLRAVSCTPRDSAHLLRPPGAQGESDFMARCIKCGKCIEACPYVAITVADGSSGLAVGTPVIDAREQACRLCDDFPCVTACPTDALRDVTARDEVHMGTAVIDEEVCIAFQGMRCEVCYRVCPLIDEAITIDYRMREGDDIHAVFAPIIDKERCVGCGLCVERCVVSDPYVPIRIATDDKQSEA
ncbi:4Fe-4S dicluster domain-containing protein [Eggerthella sp. YY7918]|uniref:4Fe-4S dicluster domain-containing protein n=1 Tax=Eggerthella sp. (strain YY7918) TaxID=502558 RepID=UPI0002170EB6|nr:4Fe-4S dicluster domain-containing protein [Eggerthella sp. YY7918]BAK43608.1 hypothetical protein EGYY_03850 [Eggerthella sp. YY7918]